MREMNLRPSEHGFTLVYMKANDISSPTEINYRDTDNEYQRRIENKL